MEEQYLGARKAHVRLFRYAASPKLGRRWTSQKCPYHISPPPMVWIPVSAKEGKRRTRRCSLDHDDREYCNASIDRVQRIMR
jgi:hypothetical protein